MAGLGSADGKGVSDSKRMSFYENVPRRRPDITQPQLDEQICLGILKTLDGSEIFNDITLSIRASRVVCEANHITRVAPATAIGNGKAVKIPVKLATPDVPLEQSDFTFANRACTFYIIDSRPQKPGTDTLLRSQSRSTVRASDRELPKNTNVVSDTLLRSHSRSTDRASEREVPKNTNVYCVPTMGLGLFAAFKRWVERNPKYATDVIFTLAVVLFVVVMVFVVFISLWPFERGTDNDANLTANIPSSTDKEADYSAIIPSSMDEDADYEAILPNSTDEDVNLTEINLNNESESDTDVYNTSDLTLQQLHEKQQRELNTPRLACDLVYASRSVVESLDPSDTIRDWTNVIQRIALAKCPKEANCPTDHQCVPDSFVLKKVAVHLVYKPPNNEMDYVAKGFKEAASCSCQPSNLLEDLTKDVDFEHGHQRDGRTKRTSAGPHGQNSANNLINAWHYP